MRGAVQPGMPRTHLVSPFVLQHYWVQRNAICNQRGTPARKKLGSVCTGDGGKQFSSPRGVRGA